MAVNKQNNVDIVAVAKAARVSISTVSRSFNHPELLKPATRKKIDNAVRKLGYIRNRAAQTMHGIRSGTIGLVVPTIDHTIFAEVIQAFSDTVNSHGFTILVAAHGYDLDREYDILRKFLEHRVDGLALIGLEHSEETFLLIERQNIPAISIWNYADGSRLPCIGANNHKVGRLAARHLIDLGHRDITLIFPPTHGNDRALARMTGALDELAKAGIAVPRNRVLEAPYSLSDAKEAAANAIAAGPLPSAMLCGNDVLATGAIYAAHRHGLQVPQDISVIGIGDFRGSRDMEPALTTVRIPARKIGDMAGQQLAQAIISSELPDKRTDFEIELRVRATCRPASPARNALPLP